MLTYFLDFGGSGVASGVHVDGTERYRTVGGADFGVGTVISVWYRRDDVTTNGQVIIGSQDEISTDQGPESVRTWCIRATTTGVDFVSIYAADGVPRTTLAVSGSAPVDKEWHHVLVYISTWTQNPGNFVLDLYHDGVGIGNTTASGPGTTFHDNGVYQGYADLGYIYQVSSGTESSLYATQPFTGDIAQAWIGPDSVFNIRDYFFFGPVNLGADGRSANPTDSHVDVYDRVDFPFESDALMQNISTRATRIPVLADAANGIYYKN